MNGWLKTIEEDYCQYINSRGILYILYWYIYINKQKKKKKEEEEERKKKKERRRQTKHTIMIINNIFRRLILYYSNKKINVDGRKFLVRARVLLLR